MSAHNKDNTEASTKNAGKISKYLRHVIADVSTRWNSSYLAWCHLLELEKYICILEVELSKDTNSDSKKDSHTMNPIMIHIIDKLKLVSALSEEINFESINDIFLELEICNSENEQNLDKPIQTFGALEKVKETLYCAMLYYWKKDNNESYLLSILDPRVKKFNFASHKLRQVQDLLKTKYYEAKTLPTSGSVTLSAISNIHNTQSVSSFYKPTLFNIFNNLPATNSQSELDEYLTVPQIPFESDPFA
ncbi:2302_t:CDS:2 [Scutellospora calospora]|uniref:2302_t:CDS:1 n=1 Tax=Scutellospora calospora TaxID=85575 RepID=A0ACA9KKE9_9GLOM|nr:2302_t:CDS:2 [Scutellospora calospora]